MQIVGLVTVAVLVTAVSSLDIDSLVKRKGPLTAGFGMVTTLTKTDLKIRPESREDRCQVRVLATSTQRVGRLLPSEFPCNFKDGSVTYEHFGLPNWRSDTVELLINYVTSDGATLAMPLSLVVDVLPKDYKVVRIESAVSVDNLRGFSAPISQRHLQFHFNRLTQECKLTLLSSANAWPR